jgi:hypothetical protein
MIGPPSFETRERVLSRANSNCVPELNESV